MKKHPLFISAMLAIAVFSGCTSQTEAVVKIAGEAQGTTYHISYIDNSNTEFKSDIDAILRKIDSSVSTYLPGSIISRINDNDTTVLVDKYFEEVFRKAMEVSATTEGAFDVTIGQLVNAYGFGKSKKLHVDSIIVDSLKTMTGYQTVRIENGRLIKSNPKTLLDFNAIAQGYSVEVLCDFLDSKGISNYLVELGGELKTKGSKQGQSWKVGIDKPNDTASAQRQIEAIVSLDNKALCTSGNYRKYYVEDGKKFAHIIDPRTGYPARQNILSSTVVADDCTMADAYATAFMVMGLEAAKSFLQKHPDLGLEVYIIYTEEGKWKTFISKGLKEAIEELN